MKYAAAYLRRSYATEGRPGDASEATQLEAVQRLCGADVTVYKDWGMSGRRSDRPDYLRLQADIRAGSVASVCAYSLSRLGRSTRELLDFVALCRDNGVTLRTAVESIDTSGAMGRLLFTIMASVAEFEADVTTERMKGARLAGKARQEAAGALYGGKVPGSIPLYGYRNVAVKIKDGGDGVIRRELDPDHPIEPILQAYRDAGGSLTRAATLLNERGIASPKAARTGGTALWGSSTLARVIRGHDPSILPDRGATGKQRPVGKPALFRGLLRCHCGRLMTPNVARGQYRCSAGNGKLSAAVHGRSTVSESALKAALWSEVARQYWSTQMGVFKDRDERAIFDLKARRERVAAAMLDGLIDASRAKSETDAIDAKLEKLQREAGAFVWYGVPEREGKLDLNGDPAEQNERLRRLWLRVQLDDDMAPTVEWIIDPDVARAQEEALIASENEGSTSSSPAYRSVEEALAAGVPDRRDSKPRARVASAPVEATETVDGRSDA